MYPKCPKCNTKNVKCIKTEVEKVTCECLDCSERFESKPTKKLCREFNS
jgi:Zn finger protein HypA/HybF involved in hydrogenase expression